MSNLLIRGGFWIGGVLIAFGIGLGIGRTIVKSTPAVQNEVNYNINGKEAGVVQNEDGSITITTDEAIITIKELE